LKTLVSNYKRHRMLYWLCLAVMTYFFIFSFLPMGGLVIAFQKYKLAKGILGSSFIGLDQFARFFNSQYCWRVIRNTVVIGGLDLLFTFPAPILLAFMLNETKNQLFKRTIQTVTYMPYFISMIVICGLIKNFTDSQGAVTQLYHLLGGMEPSLITSNSAFRSIFISTNVWQTIGFNSIIYLAALSAIDQELYEAVKIDGAGYFKQWLHVTLPGITSTIIIMLILRVGQIMNVNFEKILLLYSTTTYEVADVMSSFIYRSGLVNGEYSYSAAIGLINSLVGLGMILMANAISRHYTETSLF
jgi:putative aldouronate transport system permease protein